jgi:ankyrin repeat protein
VTEAGIDGEVLYDDCGESLLHSAVRKGSVEVARLLLTLGRVPADLPNVRGETALQLVCRSNDVPVSAHAPLVALLLQAGADPKQQNSSDGPPLFLASVFGRRDVDVLALLLEAGADVDTTDCRGVGALHFAVMAGDESFIRWLLHQGATVDAQTGHGTTPLMLAAKRGDLGAMDILLQASAHHAVADCAGCTALMQALEAGHARAVNVLLSSGASLDVVDRGGRSAVFHAVMGGCDECLVTVIGCGARTNVLDEEGRSPLYQACLMGNLSLAERLVQAGADPSFVGRDFTVRAPVVSPKSDSERLGDIDGERDAENEVNAVRACLEEARSCLQTCATLAHNELLTSLLDRGADVNARPGPLGWTSVHLCAVVGNDEGLNILLSRGADVTVVDALGNSAAALATKSGHTATLAILTAAEASAAEAIGDEAVPSDTADAQLPEAGDGESKPAQSPARRRLAPGGPLPPLLAGPSAEAPDEEEDPLEVYGEEWTERPVDGTLLDRVVGPQLHDALRCDRWRVRWAALAHLTKEFEHATGGTPSELIAAVGQLVAEAADDKVSKVFTASLNVFEVLLADARLEDIETDEFASRLRGTHPSCEDQSLDVLELLLHKADEAGGSSSASSPQQAAVEALCSCILHGRVTLDEAAWPLLARVDKRLRVAQRKDLTKGAKDSKDRKEAALVSKRLAANLKLLGRWLAAFGLQQSGLFRRALILPLLLRGVVSEHSKVRAAAGDALVQLMAFSGGLEERVWALVPPKVQKTVQALARGREAFYLISAAPCEEDVIQKPLLITEDARAAALPCVSELTPQLWAQLQEGIESPSDRAPTLDSKTAEHGNHSTNAVCDALQRALSTKSWEERVKIIETISKTLGSGGSNVELADGTADGANGELVGGLISQYAIQGYRLSDLQTALASLLGDTVTAVFVVATDLLRIVCSHVSVSVAPLFLEPLLPVVLSRLQDSSYRVKAKASESILEVALVHGGPLAEFVAAFCADGAWSAVGAAKRDGDRNCDRGAAPRLNLLVKIIADEQVTEMRQRWTDETWRSLGEYALRCLEHRNADVRNVSAALLECMSNAGERAAVVAEHCASTAQQKTGKRPGTGARPPTGPMAPQSRAGSRAGSRASAQRPASRAGQIAEAARLSTPGRLSNAGSTGFTLNMGSTLNSTGRLSTGTGRLSTASLGSTARLPTGLKRVSTGAKLRDEAEESDNSVYSDAPPAVPEGCGPDGGVDDDGVQFFNVQTCCPGADEVPDVEAGEAALREAIPLAEELDEMALEFVAPLLAAFGQGWTKCFYSRQWQCRVAALVHLAATMPSRVQEVDMASPQTFSELLDAAMRAVHEGMGDQNQRVYVAACVAVVAVVPPFCDIADGQLLVAHLAPLLRQLVSRTGDGKEAIRAQSTQSLLRLLRPPTGNIVNPSAVATLLLRHLDPCDGSSAKAATSGRGLVNAWLCRIGTLRIMAKEYGKGLVGASARVDHPGEWLALKAGLAHIDPMVRRESARLFALVCKLHVKLSAGNDELAQLQIKRAWVLELGASEASPKSLEQVRKLLKLPEDDGAGSEASPTPGQRTAAPVRSLPPWDVPASLTKWICATTGAAASESLGPLRSPALGDEKAVVVALRTLTKAVCDCGDNERPEALKEAAAAGVFSHICDAILQALASPTGADRSVFLRAVELCFKSNATLAPALPSLDINMGLSKIFPIFMERTSAASAGDVKIAVSSDKLVQKLAKHPKVGCETVTKMILAAIARSERPVRQLVLLHTLLSDFGLRLCAQRDIMALLLGALGTQLERLASAGAGSVAASSTAASLQDENAMASLRTQLVLLLSICNEFSPDTVKICMAEVDMSQRKLLADALQAAPDKALVALGAAAAEQEELVEAGHIAGSVARALSRGRGTPAGDTPMERNPLRRSRQRLPPVEDVGLTSAGAPAVRASASSRQPEYDTDSGRAVSLPLSEASTTASTDGHPTKAPPSPTASPRAGFSVTTSTSRTSTRWCNENPASRPPAPLGLSTALGGSGSAKPGVAGECAPAAWRFRDDAQEKMCYVEDSKRLKRAPSGRHLKKRSDVISVPPAVGGDL